MAKKYSTDPTTKNKGGVLTNVSKGQQDAALSQAAFSIAANKIVGPIKGQFGYYVLEVTKITPAKTKTLAQSTALIHQTLLSSAPDRRAERGQRSRQEELVHQDHVPVDVRDG